MPEFERAITSDKVKRDNVFYTWPLLLHGDGDVGPEKKSEVITFEVRQHLQIFPPISKRICKDETKFQPCNISLHSKFRILFHYVAYFNCDHTP